MGPHSAASLPGAHIGPSNDDPLTDDELALLLAVPRAAESTPNATLFRLPLGPSPLMGWVDVTCLEARNIVASLAETWKTRFSELLRQSDNPTSSCPVGPGTTICLLLEPDYHGIFHLLAFWALGCTILCVSAADPSILDIQLERSQCKVLVHSGFNNGWVQERKKRFEGAIVQLPEEEQAHRLAQSEKQKQAGTSVPWPTPQRPSPSLVILQSTGTTGIPKLMWLSLHYYTLEHSHTHYCRAHLKSTPSRTHKTPRTHPLLILSPFFWSNFYVLLFDHLTTVAPIAFAYYKNIIEFSSTQLIEWATAFDAGGIVCDAGQILQTPRATLEAHAELFRSLYSFSLSGVAINNTLSRIFEELDIRITNIYGMSEIGRLMYCNQAPYTHLRPLPGMPPPVVHPISEIGPDGSRHVELWFLLSTFRPLAHHHAHSAVPVKIEPFPGDGPHKGELAFNLGDVFQELTVDTDPTRGPTTTVYVHAGRYSDLIRLSGTWCDDMNASLYESQLMSEINTRTKPAGDQPWMVGAIQLFGTNIPCTALIVQLRRSEKDHGSERPDDLLIQQIYDAVEKVNQDLKLSPGLRVHTGKRMLIVSSDGTFKRGPGVERLAGSCSSLTITHKRTAKRWVSTCEFKPWLDGLDFSEP